MLKPITRDAAGRRFLISEGDLFFVTQDLRLLRSLYSEACQDVYVWNFLILENLKTRNVRQFRHISRHRAVAANG